MATSSTVPKPDLGSLRIHDGQRKGSKTGKRVGLAVLGLVLLAGIAAAAYAFRNTKTVVDVATAGAAEAGGRQALLNASGYVTPRRRATIAAKITGRVTSVHFDEGTHVQEGQLLATLDAVSYTHLDVYKRQGAISPPSAAALSGTGMLNA